MQFSFNLLYITCLQDKNVSVELCSHVLCDEGANISRSNIFFLSYFYCRATFKILLGQDYPKMNCKNVLLRHNNLIQ